MRIFLYPLAFSIFVSCALTACAREASIRQNSSGITVVVEANGVLTSEQRAQLKSAGIEVEDFLGNGEYLGYVPSESDISAVQGRLNPDTKVRSFRPERKLADGFDVRDVPEHAQVGSKIRVLVEFFEAKSLDPEGLLSGYGEDIKIDDNTARWGITIDPEVVVDLSKEGAVKRIDLREDPGLLRMDE